MSLPPTPQFTYTALADGRSLGLWVHAPATPPAGFIMVLHEAFGITPHIKRVCADYAAEGYLVAAPALLMPATGVPEGVVLEQNKEGLDTAREMIMGTPLPTVIAMLQATAAWGQNQGGQNQGLPCAAVGFCWGGSCAYVAGAQVPGLRAVVGYYGGLLAELTAQMQPSCPTLIHLATEDRYIPLQPTQAALATHHPAAQVLVYAADHGFNRDDGKTFNPTAAAAARATTLTFIAQSLC